MPRQARVIVPGFPHHIVQRGHHRQPVFVELRDFEKQICPGFPRVMRKLCRFLWFPVSLENHRLRRTC
jgi:REP element-mobilizing transposase RayT